MKYIISILLLCAILTGCGNTATEPTMPTETVPQTEASVLHYTLYIPNNNADGWNTAEITTNEITPENILAELLQRGIIAQDVILQGFHREDDVLNMDFNAAFADQICSTGTAGEMMLIGSVVNTFLDAYQAEEVYLTVNGGILESGHAVYDSPISYME